MCRTIERLLIAISTLIVLVFLWVGFQELANRFRAVRGECRQDSIRCLGCMATVHCRAAARPESRLRKHGHTSR